MSFGELADRLVALGLEAPLAETYLHLLMQGTIRPAAFASVLQASRSEGYRRLERLADFGLAAASKEQPVEFHAEDPEMLFHILHRMQKGQVEAIESALNELQPILSRLRGSVATQSGQTFRYLAGRLAFYEELHQLLDLAKEEVLVVNTHPSGAALAERSGLWSGMDQLAANGISQRIVMTDLPALRRRPERSAIRVLPQAEIMNFAIVDRRSTVFCTAIDESASKHGRLDECVVTNAPSLLAAQLTLFERLWGAGTALNPGKSFEEEYHYPEALGPAAAAPVAGGFRR